MRMRPSTTKSRIPLGCCLTAVGLYFALINPVCAQDPAAGEAFRDCPECPEMVVVPAGAFVMGTMKETEESAEHPAEHELTLVRIERAFAIGRHEVTRAEFAAFAVATGFQPASACRSWDAERSRFDGVPIEDWQNPGFPARLRDDHPVICVDWHESRDYAEWLSAQTGQRYRLPSEAEWEYAAKAGTQTLRFWGDDPFEGCDFANTYDRTASEVYPLAWQRAECADGYADLAPVGSLQPNAFGLHDMIGNVWEWVEDCSSRSYIGRPKDQRAWVWDGCVRRIQRGGSWITAPARSRSAYHGDGRSTDRAVFFGFRLVRELSE